MKHRAAVLAFAAVVSTHVTGCLDFFGILGSVQPGEGPTMGSLTTEFTTFESYCGELMDRGGLFGVSCALFIDPAVGISTYVGPSEIVCGLCLDPIVMQFPSAAYGFAGTFSGPPSGNLVIQSGLSCIDTAPGQPQICAEAGNQLIIVDLPPGTPFGSFSATITFDLPSAQAIQVKALATGKASIGGVDYFPPLYPCVASFASLPSVTIPVNATEQQIAIPDLSSFTGCQGTIGPANGGAAQAPALKPFLLAILGAGLIIGGAAMLRRRRI